jgi:uracil-DNA glycosylase
MNKHARLLSLARLRQATRWNGYTSIADYHGGAYECDFISPYTKTAGNVDAAIMVLLQDWSSHENLSGPIDEMARDFGYTPTEPTSRTLARLLQATFGLTISEVYGTNLFPFVKPKGMSKPIPNADLVKAAREFALPQIEIVNPRLVICLGMATFNAVRSASGLRRVDSMETALNAAFTTGTTQMWCQAHTGHFGQLNRNRGGVDRVSDDWRRMQRNAFRDSADRKW